jgi:hypothetical protein
MDSIFRIGNRLKSGDDFIKKCGCSNSQLIANEFWTITTNLTKRVAIVLKNSSGVLVANTTVKWAVMEYSDGIPQNESFMKIVEKGVYTTDLNGNFDVVYTGVSQIGGFAYLMIMQPDASPTESLIWKVTIV